LTLFAGGHPLVGVLLRDGRPALVAATTDLVPAVFRGVTARLHPYGRNYVVVPARVDQPEPEEGAVIALFAAKAPAPDAAHAATAVLREAGVRRVGVDEGGAADLYRALVAALPGIECVPAAKVWRRVRAIKEPGEIECLREAARIVEAAMEEVWRYARPGVSELELARQAVRVMTDAGARPTLWYVGVGRASALVDRLPTHRAAERGDIIMVDFGCEYQGYYADLARTAVVGEPSPRVVEYYAAVRAAEAAAIARIRAGRAAADVFTRAVATARSAGIPHFDRRHVGHGIGLEPYDLPILTGATEDTLAAGVVLNVETPYYEVGFGGLQLEDTLTVTQEGVESLSVASRDLRML
jgi:Xaa-Pro aminopeptidase